MTKRKVTYEELQGIVRTMLRVMRRISEDDVTIEDAQALVSGLISLDQKVALDPEPQAKGEVRGGEGTWAQEDSGTIKLTFAIPQSLAKLAAAEDVYVETLEDLYKGIDKMALKGRRLSKEVMESLDQVAAARAEVRRYRGGGG